MRERGERRVEFDRKRTQERKRVEDGRKERNEGGKMEINTERKLSTCERE